MEESLRSSENYYRSIVENTQDLIELLDTKGIIYYASPCHEKVLGFSPNEYEGKLAFDLVHSDDLAQIQKQYANMVLSKRPCKDKI